MKKIILIIACIMSTMITVQAQSFNWQSLSEEKQNLAFLDFGYDFGATIRVGYGHVIKSPLPILITLDHTFYMGNQFLDDFKSRIGGQVQLINWNHLVLSAKIMGNFRRYETIALRAEGFGAEFSATAGFYKNAWYVAAEIGLDKSVITHLKHYEPMTDNFPGIQDGWYLPAGGNYFYGIQAGRSIGRLMDLSLRVGLTNAEGDHLNAMLPYYAQLGLSKSF